MTIKTNQIKEIKIASNRFNVNVIIPNQDKNAKCNIYVSSEQGVNDLFLISIAEKNARDNSMVANKKGELVKNGDLYKANLKAFDMLFLADRENRTFLNAIRRLADNPKYSKENCLEMINSEFGKKQNFVNPNTLLNKVDKYFSESETSPENSEKDEQSKMEKVYNAIMTLSFREKCEIAEFLNEDIAKNRKEIKHAKSA